MQYNARELLTWSVDDIWNLPDLENITVVMDDGIITTDVRFLIFSTYIWDVHRAYPLTPLLKRHFLQGRYTGNSHIELLSHAVFDCWDEYKLKQQPIDMESLCRIPFMVFNNIFNDFTYKLEEDVASACALDFVDVMMHPDIKSANDHLQALEHVSKYDIDICNNAISSVLLTAPELASNAISKAIRAGTVRMNQVLQCVGPRGFVTDIDSYIFHEPIRVGYAEGFSKLEDAMKVSREASQSLLFTKGPMQDTEYFNRCEQLVAASIHHIHPSDCGSRDYLPATISSRRLLLDMAGVYYFDETTNQEHAITQHSTHLLGKTIKIRSVLTCKHSNPYAVCARCFGELSLSVPEGTNIGYISAAQLQGPVGQLILSNKHYTGSAGVDELCVSEANEHYITTGADENCIYINPKMKGRLLSIALDEKEIPNLTDILVVEDVRMVSPFRISEVSVADFTYMEGDAELGVVVDLINGARVGSLSREFLAYVKEIGWSIGNRNEYIIDMTDWDMSLPFIQMPLKHFSTVDFMKSIESFIKGGSTKGAKSITNYDTAFAALIALHDLVSQRLSVNIAYLQIVILATLVRSRVERDYRLPVDRANAVPARYNQIMSLHSLTAGYAYEGQQDLIFSAESFLVKVRPRHPLDYMVLR